MGGEYGQSEKSNPLQAEDNVEFADAVEGFPAQFQAIPNVPNITAFYKFDVLQSQKSEAGISWLTFLNSGLGDNPITFQSFNRFPRALILIARQEGNQIRRYALVFGMHADQPLDKEKIVHDFGLRVGMNICDAETGIKRLQTAAHEAISVQMERQASAGTSLGGFSIDLDAENIRTLSGIARGEFREQIANVRGKDQITFRLPQDDELEWASLAEYIDLLEARSLSRDYENTEFRDFDRFRLETDPEVTDQLDELVAASIEARDFERLHLAPPEFIDEDDALFAYRPRAEDGELPQLFEDLSIVDLINQPRRRLADMTADRIKSWKIYRYDSERDFLYKYSSAYRCLVAEVSLDERTFILSGGHWREVSQMLIEEVENYLTDEISVVERDFLPSNVNIYDAVTRKNRESVYCRTVSENFEQIYCFDQSNIVVAGRAQYEICDLFSLDKEFVQAKRYSSGSASITHLFLQSRFYAHAFSTDRETCRDMRRWLAQDTNEWNAGKNKAGFLALIPQDRQDVVEQDYTIIFCILHTSAEMDLDDLPFMARYELSKSHRFLTRDRKFSASVAFVRVETS